MQRTPIVAIHATCASTIAEYNKTTTEPTRKSTRKPAHRFDVHEDPPPSDAMVHLLDPSEFVSRSEERPGDGSEKLVQKLESGLMRGWSWSIEERPNTHGQAPMRHPFVSLRKGEIRGVTGISTGTKVSCKCSDSALKRNLVVSETSSIVGAEEASAIAVGKAGGLRRPDSKNG